MNILKLVHFIGPIIGFFALVIGIFAVLRPKPMSKNFGIAAGDSALPFVVSTGVRDVFIGLIVLILFFMENWQALGAANLCIGIVAICDFFVVRKHGDKKVSLVHLGGAVAVIGYGALLVILHSSLVI